MYVLPLLLELILMYIHYMANFQQHLPHQQHQLDQ